MKKTFFLLILTILALHLFCQTKNPLLRLNTPMHMAKIEDMSIDKKGEIILTVSRDKTAKLWESKGGKLIKTLHPPIDQENGGMLYSGTLSPDGKIAAVGGWSYFDEETHNIYIFHTITGEIQQTISGLKNVILDLEFSPDGKYLAVGLGEDQGVNLYKTQNRGSKYEHYKSLSGGGFSGYSDNCYDVEFDSNGRLATVCYDGKIRLYNDKFELIEKTKGSGKKPFSIAFSPDGNKIAVGYKDVVKLDVFSGTDLSLLYQPDVKGKYANIERKNKGQFFYGLAFSADGNHLYGGGYYFTFDTQGRRRRVIRKWENSGKGSFKDFPVALNSITNIISLPEGNILFTGSHPDFGKISSNGQVKYYKKGNVANFGFKDKSHFRVNHAGDKIAFTPFGHDTLFFSLQSRKLKKFNKQQGLESYKAKTGNISVIAWQHHYNASIISNGNRTHKIKFSGQEEISRSVDISSNKDFIALGTNFNIYLTNKKGKEIWKKPIQEVAWCVNISGNGKYVLAALGDGSINWYSTKDGKLLLTLFVHPQKKDWIIYNPKGLFDASRGAEDLVGWHINRGIKEAAKFYPLDLFYERYYEPNLAVRLLTGENIATENNLNKNIKLPPEIEILKPQNNLTFNKQNIEVKIQANDLGGGIDEIRLYHNSKIIHTTQKGLKKPEDEKQQIIKKYTIQLVEGKNTIKATAFNSQRTEAIPDTFMVKYKGEESFTDLHVIAIGINHYKNTSYNLNFAFQGAKSIHKTLNENGTNYFNRINTHYLKDEEATKEKIKKAFNQIKQNSGPEDIFIFYFAGQTAMTKGSNSEFFLTPHDLPEIGENFEGLIRKGLSANYLEKQSREIEARKQLFLIDGCYTPSNLKNAGTSEASIEKAIAQTARNTGAYWLTSLDQKQSKQKFDAIGHRLFTYSILQGLQGKADKGSKDSQVTVRELSSYLNRTLPILSKKYNGVAQYPNTYGYGRDFPVVIMN